MPTYEYECPRCGTFEVEQKISDPTLTACPRPGNFEPGRRVVFPPFGGAVGAEGTVVGPSDMGEGWVLVKHEPAVYEHPDGTKTTSPDTVSIALEHLTPLPCGAPVRRLIAGGMGFVLNGGGWAKDGYGGSRGG
jgi:putative FmdB family regulatory protein